MAREYIVSQARPGDLLALSDGRLGIVSLRPDETQPLVEIYASVNYDFKYRSAETINLDEKVLKLVRPDLPFKLFSQEAVQALKLLGMPSFSPVFLTEAMLLATTLVPEEPAPAPVLSELETKLAKHGLTLPQFPEYQWDCPTADHASGWDLAAEDFTEGVVEPLLKRIEELEAQLKS